MSRKTRDNVRQHGVLADLFVCDIENSDDMSTSTPMVDMLPPVVAKKFTTTVLTPFPRGRSA